MTDTSSALIIEGYIAANGNGGIDALLVIKQLERIRAGALQMADAIEILLGQAPTTAQMRHEWRQIKRGNTRNG